MPYSSSSGHATATPTPSPECSEDEELIVAVVFQGEAEEAQFTRAVKDLSGDLSSFYFGYWLKKRTQYTVLYRFFVI